MILEIKFTLYDQAIYFKGRGCKVLSTVFKFIFSLVHLILFLRAFLVVKQYFITETKWNRKTIHVEGEGCN